LLGELQAAGGKSLDQLRLPGSAALDRLDGSQVPRPADNQDEPDQRNRQPGPKIMPLDVPQAGIHRRLWDAFKHEPEPIIPPSLAARDFKSHAKRANPEALKSEIRRPKSEGNPKSEVRKGPDSVGCCLRCCGWRFRFRTPDLWRARPILAQKRQLMNRTERKEHKDKHLQARFAPHVKGRGQITTPVVSLRSLRSLRLNSFCQV